MSFLQHRKQPEDHPTSKPGVTSDALKSLWGSSKPTVPLVTPEKLSKPKPAQKSIVKDDFEHRSPAIFRKEYYKANHSYGIKKVCGGKAKQIFSLSNKSWSKDRLCLLADKVLHDLTKCKSVEEEASIELLAKYKLCQ